MPLKVRKIFSEKIFFVICLLPESLKSCPQTVTGCQLQDTGILQLVTGNFF